MTFFGMALLTAAGTIILAVFAVVTAWYARKAFLKQSEDIKDQAKLIEVQSRQLRLQRLEFEEQRKVNAEQIRVLELQAEERGIPRRTEAGTGGTAPFPGRTGLHMARAPPDPLSLCSHPGPRSQRRQVHRGARGQHQRTAHL